MRSRTRFTITSLFLALVLYPLSFASAQIPARMLDRPQTGCTVFVAPGTNVIQAALDSLPANGGTVCLAGGTYTQTTALKLGDGSTSAISTKNGMVLRGIAPPTSDGYQTWANAAATIIDCTGVANGDCIDVDGPVEGWGVENLRLVGGTSGIAPYGLYVRGGRFGTARNLDIYGFGKGVFLSTWATWTGPGTMRDTLHNIIENIQITAVSGSTHCFHADGQNNNANVDFNFVTIVHCHMIGVANVTFLELGWTDNNIFSLFTAGGGGTGAKGLVLNYGSGVGLGPINNAILNFDSATDSITNSGTPGGSAKNNFMLLSEANGATCPGLANLIVYGCSTGYFNNLSVRGTIAQTGSTSGAVTQQVQAAAGTWNWNWPTSAGSSGQPLLSGGGGSTAMTWGTLGVGAGGTGITSGTSGGVPYFSGSTTIASSGALTANLPVIGGGAGTAPSVGTRSGNTTQFVTTTGTQTSGRCVEIDANGNHIASAAGCAVGTLNGARAYNNANLSISNTTVTALTLNSERFDNGGLHSTASNTSRITFPSACVAVVTANVQWAASTAGSVRSVLIRLNGTTSIGAAVQPGFSAAFQMSVASLYSFAANDYVEIAVYQDSGGSLNIVASGNESPELSAQCITS